MSDNPLFQLVCVIKIYTSPSNAQSQLNSRILIFCIYHFWNSSPFLCLGWPPLLVSSVSNLHPDMKGQKWSFIQAFLLSWAMEREVHFKQTLLRCLASAHSGWTIQGLPWPKVACISHVQDTRFLDFCKGAVLGGPCISSGELP